MTKATTEETTDWAYRFRGESVTHRTTAGQQAGVALEQGLRVHDWRQQP